MLCLIAWCVHMYIYGNAWSLPRVSTIHNNSVIINSSPMLKTVRRLTNPEIQNPNFPKSKNTKT